MAKVIVTKRLLKDLLKVFKKNKTLEILEFFRTLEENPKKGKEIARVGKIVLKELKFESFRFYFITDGFSLKFLKDDELKDLVLKFVRMSKKSNQQKVINEIKEVLQKLGFEGF